MSEQELAAIVPIDEVLPELRAEQYAQVRAWDDARMALASGYEAADGEYLRKIRDALQEADGARTPLWKHYLDARGIPYETARNRIWKAEQHIATPRDKAKLALSPVQVPTLPSPNTANIGRRAEPEPAPAYEPVAAFPVMQVGTPDDADAELERRMERVRAQAEADMQYDAPEDEVLAIASDANLPTFGQLIGERMAFHRANTREAQSEPFAAFLNATRLIPESEDSVSAWLDVRPRDHWSIGLSKLARLRAFIERAEQIINERVREVA